MNIAKKLVLIASLLCSSAVWAHGYMTAPAARGYLCKLGTNSNCGAIQWEPQSLEAPSGFPNGGPANGKLASAGLSQFAGLDVQTSDRWAKNDIQAGQNVFSWHLTANHVTRNWRYYITKQDWNPNAPLTRDSFDLTPFCVVEGGMVRPAVDMSHSCNVPQRTGYQVILAVWEIGDTANSFYNVIDVRFKDGGQPSSAWAQAGTIYPSVDLTAGDKVKTRVFNASGEVSNLETTLAITNNEAGQRDNWSYQLAAKINSEQTLLQAGQLKKDNKFDPIYGQNPIYIKSGSGLTRVEVQIDKQQSPIASDFTVNGLKPTYVIQNNKVTLNFSVTTQGNLKVSNYVYNHEGTAKGFAEASINNSSHSFSLALNDVKAGHYQLVIKASEQDGTAPIQKTFDMTFTEKNAGGNYDFTFPESLSAYKEGTRVLQPKNGKVYQCKAFPYSGFCMQWSKSATQYEPGVGSHWQQAWTEVQ